MDYFWCEMRVTLGRVQLWPWIKKIADWGIVSDLKRNSEREQE
jgi:hypothetical protein